MGTTAGTHRAAAVIILGLVLLVAAATSSAREVPGGGADGGEGGDDVSLEHDVPSGPNPTTNSWPLSPYEEVVVALLSRQRSRHGGAGGKSIGGCSEEAARVGYLRLQRWDDHCRASERRLRQLGFVAGTRGLHEHLFTVLLVTGVRILSWAQLYPEGVGTALPRGCHCVQGSCSSDHAEAITENFWCTAARFRRPQYWVV